MSNWKLLCREIAHRKMNFLLSLLAMTAAAMLFIAGPTLMEGYKEESDQQLRAMQVKADTDLANLDKRTKRIMRDLGFNLRIVHKNTDLSRLYASFVSFDMPESYVTTLAEAPEITKIVHLVATLKQMIELEGKPRLLVGFAPEATQSHIEQKAPMGFQIKQGTVFLGHLAGEGFEVGESIEVLGKSFEIANILAPRGTRDEDIFVAMHLKDAQQLLEKEGLISEIVALGCKCKTVDRVQEIMAQLEAVLPEARVVELSTRAIAREEQRQLVSKHYQQQMNDYEAGREGIRTVLLGLNNQVIPLIVLVCVTWAGLLAWTNVRQRRTEIGLLRALGKNSTGIISLLLGKALIVGLLGGILGSLMGLAIASQLAQSELLAVSAENFQAPTLLLVVTIGGAPLVAALASYLPTLIAVQQDPAVVLMDG
jgi:ABC-type lipoprotein release transport system permease subunit|tara:strand:+ start:1418 stop:2692 length:1275 start_codon:yes stop_codon:yes gene_type:complete